MKIRSIKSLSKSILTYCRIITKLILVNNLLAGFDGAMDFSTLFCIELKS